eukprot:171501-Rhodomonas_salina.1
MATRRLCNEIDLYERQQSKYTQAQRRNMEGCVAAGSNAQGKLSLCVLAFMAGKLGELSAPCALKPGIFRACTEDAMLTDATDPTKQHYIEAKTCGEIVANSNRNSAHYKVQVRWRHDDGRKTRWGSLIGFLRPAGAKFRIFQTTGDTLSQIFDNMADSCYEVFIAHHPKMEERARAGNLLCLDPHFLFSSVPISA